MATDDVVVEAVIYDSTTDTYAIAIPYEEKPTHYYVSVNVEQGEFKAYLTIDQAVELYRMLGVTI